MTRFLVTGASGLLGLNFALQVASKNSVVGVVNQQGLSGAPFSVVYADLTLPGTAEKLLEDKEPEVLIHCAAIANLEECEAHPEMAQRLNAVVPGELAAAACRLGIHMVYISTDAVFDGKQGEYIENDQPNPLSVYALTKLTGERSVANANPDALIARVNFYGWSLSGQRSLAEFFFYNLSAGRRINGFEDVFFCPLEVNDLVDILLHMIEKRLSGLYHVVSSESLSKYEFGCSLARQFSLEESLITPISWQDGGLKATRSPNLTLSSDKLSRALGKPPPGQLSGIQRFHSLYLQNYPQRISSYAVAE